MLLCNVTVAISLKLLVAQIHRCFNQKQVLSSQTPLRANGKYFLSHAISDHSNLSHSLVSYWGRKAGGRDVPPCITIGILPKHVSIAYTDGMIMRGEQQVF
jgi:hypothetical protein